MRFAHLRSPPHRNSASVTRRRKFKRIQRGAPRQEEDFCCENERASEPDTGSCSVDGLVPTRSQPLRDFVEANPNSPAEPLQDHLFNSLDAAPDPSDTVNACSYWRSIVVMMRGRQWGEFAYDLLAIPDGEQFRKRLKDFESVLFAVDKIVAIAVRIRDTAFEKDPSGTAGTYLESKWLTRDVEIASLHLEEIVSLRRDSLDVLHEFARDHVLEFQNL